MSSIYEFAVAALPWIALGLLLAVFCVRAASRKKTRKKIDDYTIYKSACLNKCREGRSGFCQVISDGPANNPENPIADTILQLIYSSHDILYIIGKIKSTEKIQKIFLLIFQ